MYHGELDERVQASGDEDFLTLRKAGRSALIYAQLLSMNQLAVLERLGELKGQILAQTAESEDEGSLIFERSG